MWAFCSLSCSPGCTPLLRRPPRQGAHPPTGHSVPRQPVGGHPTRVPMASRALLGGAGVANPHGSRGLTLTARGMSNPSRAGPAFSPSNRPSGPFSIRPSPRRTRRRPRSTRPR
jgi:hypothetical protein